MSLRFPKREGGGVAAGLSASVSASLAGLFYPKTGTPKSVLIYDAAGNPAVLAGGANNGPVIFDAAGNPAVLARGADSQLLALPAGGGPPAWVGDTTWTAAAFTGATPFGNYGSGYAAAAFRKDAIGGVRIKGLVNLGTSGGTIFTLPAGFRPLENHQFAQHQYNGAGVNSYAEIVVNSNGTVVANVYTPAVGGNLSIDCYFLGEQ